MPDYFKAVRVMKDGRRVSLWVDKSLAESETGYGQKCLEYHPHRIISAPKGSNGIHLFDGGFKSRISGNTNTRNRDFSGIVEVYSVTVIGTVKEDCYWRATCQVVRVNKLVDSVKIGV